SAFASLPSALRRAASPMMVSRKSAACGGSARLVANSDAPSVAMKQAWRCSHPSSWRSRKARRSPSFAKVGRWPSTRAMKRLARSAGRRASGVLAWSWCFGAILFPTAILRAADEMATLCSSTCQLHSVVIPDCSAAAGNAVYPRCPFDLDVGDGLLGGGMQVVQALAVAALHLFYQDAALHA